jgi:hypothetical protein
LAEDEAAVLARARQRVREMDGTKLKRALEQFGSAATRKLVSDWLAP